MHTIHRIQNRIYQVRGERVMLDFDLALLYEVETRALNQAIKRNIKRFPEDFMFQLTSLEWSKISSQIGMMSQPAPSSQSVMMSVPKNRTGKYLPYAFTEQGVAMLSGVLTSEKAINMNIAIMRAFIAIRKVLVNQDDIKTQLDEIKERLGEHDTQLMHIYNALENLLDEKSATKKWGDRDRIGFKK